MREGGREGGREKELPLSLSCHLPFLSGPSLFMVLSREEAVTGWRALMGATDPEEAAQQEPNRSERPRAAYWDVESCF